MDGQFTAGRGSQRESFEGIYRQYFPRLARYCRGLTLDPHGAEDIAQDTLLRAYQKLHLFDPARPFWPWIKAIARHVAADNQRVHEVPLESDELPCACPELAQVEQRTIIETAMNRLRPRHRQLLGLRYLYDVPSGEAIARLGIARSAFNQALFRARLRLKSELRRMGVSGLGLAGPVVLARKTWRRTVRPIAIRWSNGSGRLRPAETWTAITACVLSLILPFGAWMATPGGGSRSVDHIGPQMYRAVSAVKGTRPGADDRPAVGARTGYQPGWQEVAAQDDTVVKHGQPWGGPVETAMHSARSAQRLFDSAESYPDLVLSCQGSACDPVQETPIGETLEEVQDLAGGYVDISYQ